MTPPRPTRRRWLRIGLRGLLILVAIIAVGLGWIINNARRQAAAVAWIKASGLGTAMYDDDVYTTGFLTIYPEHKPVPRRWTPPAALERWLGHDYFHYVDAVYLQGDALDGSTVERDKLVDSVTTFTRLTQLGLGPDVDDAILGRLTGLSNLQTLTFGASNTGLTVAGFRSIGRLRNLETLRVSGGSITDEELAALAPLIRLKSLLLIHQQATSSRGPGATGSGFAALANLTDLRSMYLNLPNLDGSALRSFRPFSLLDDLRIDGGVYTDDDLRPLAALRNLRSFTLVNSKIDGTGFRHLTGLGKLDRIGLDRCPALGDPAIAWLAELPALGSIQLNGAPRITAAGLEQFRSAARLRSVRVSHEPVGDLDQLKRAVPQASFFIPGH